jgi:class 3 adenylate cyclase
VVRQEATGTRPFVNRNSEREWLEERLDDARSGQPQLVLISGEPGIGKSRLVREVQRTATTRGVEVFPSRCREHLDLPYLPFTASLLPRLHLLAREDPSLSRYAPVIERLLGDEAGSGEAAGATRSEPQDQALLFVAVATATIRLARSRPVLLVVDDLHWADTASLDLFTHLALEIADTAMREPVPVMIVATYRNDANLPADVERLRREEICHQLTMRPLPAEEAGEMVRSLGLPQSTRQLENSVYHVAGGNPLFIENVVHQLTRASEEHGTPYTAASLERAAPREISDAIAERLAELSDSAQSTLTLTAVIGDHVDPGSVAHAGSLPEETVVDHLAAAATRGILEQDDDRTFHFAHPLYARAAYANAVPTRRRQLHLDVARALERQPDPQQHAIEIARHLGEAGDQADASSVLRWCRAGGDQAWGQLAWAEAARCFEAAVDAGVRLVAPQGEIGDLAYRAGVAHYRNSDPVPSRRLLERAEAAYRAAADPGGVARALTDRTRAELTAGRFGTQVALEPLEDALVALDDPALQARLLAQMADALWLGGDLDRGREFAERAVAIGSEVGEHEACTRALAALGVLDWLGLKLTDALAHLEDGLGHARASSDLWLEAIPLPRIALTQLWLGNMEAAGRYARQADDRAQATGDIAERSLGLAVDVALRVCRGDFRGAERAADDAWLASRVSRYGYSASLFLPAIATGRMLRGAFGAGESAIDKLVGNDDTELYAEGTWLLRQLVRAHAGQHDEVRRALLAHPERVAARWPVALGMVGRFASLAEIADAVDADVPFDRIDRALSRAAERGMVISDGPVFLVDRVRATVCRRLGRTDEAEQLLRSAMSRGAELGLRPELGRACLDLARLLVGPDRAGDDPPAEALDLANRARALFDELDMPAFEQQATTLLADLSGETPSRGRTVGAETAVILFTDIADSTALTERLGDAAYRTKAAQFEQTMRHAIRECRGEDIEGITLGDGVLAVFSSGTNAIDCAIRAHECARDAGFRLHVGVHAGDVLRSATSVYGGAVNIAARVCDAAPPGETLVSDTVRSLARTSASVQFVDRGLHQFKGVSDPHQVFAVQVSNPSN